MLWILLTKKDRTECGAAPIIRSPSGAPHKGRCTGIWGPDTMLGTETQENRGWAWCKRCKTVCSTRWVMHNATRNEESATREKETP